MSPHDFRNEDSQNRVRKPSRSPSRVRPAPGTRLWRQLGSTNENLPVRPSPVHEPIEHAAKQMRDSRPLPPRLAPCRTTAILRKTALKERGRRAGVVAGKDRTAPQQSQIPSGLVRCERSEEHTSELQSQSNLVCRLLLEKKKNNTLDKYIDEHDTHGRYDSSEDVHDSVLLSLYHQDRFGHFADGLPDLQSAERVRNIVHP